MTTRVLVCSIARHRLEDLRHDPADGSVTICGLHLPLSEQVYTTLASLEPVHVQIYSSWS